jgi:6-phospho-beta-glucosidase
MIISVIGGGGMRTPLLISALLRQYETIPVEALVLHDLDAEALDGVRAVAGALFVEHGRRFALRTTTDLDKALAGATYVITSIRVGGLASRIIDEQVPLAHGVIGQETTGPGGWAMAMRTIPVLQDVVARLRRQTPSAWILNFTNPAGLITQAMTAAGERRVIGICDSPVALAGRIATHLAVPPEELRVEYLGLNHLGWVRAIWVDSRDRLPDIVESDDAIRQIYGRGLFEPAEIRQLGLLPNEYLHYYYHHDRAVERLKAAPQTRGEVLAAVAADLRASIREAAARGEQVWPIYERAIFSRRASYMAAETGQHRDVALMGGHVEGGYARAALSVIDAMLHGGRRDLIVNTTNRGAISDLDDGDVVELPCRVTTSSLLPRSVGALPEGIADLVKRVKAYERATVAAAARKSWNEAVLALSRHPLVPSLDVAEEIAEEYRARHAPHLDYLR